MMPLITNTSSKTTLGSPKGRVGFSKDVHASPTSRSTPSHASNSTLSRSDGTTTEDAADDTDQVKFLREWYSKARAKHEEYKSHPNMAIPAALSRNYDDKAARLFYVLHTLLYTSICAVKANTLDKYLRTKGKTFSKSVFDLSEWDPVLRVAKECRTQELQAEKQEFVAVLSAERNELFTRLTNVRNVGLTYKTDISQLKSTVSDDLAVLRGMVSTLQVKIGEVITSFAGKQDELLKSNRREMEEEKQQRMELQHRNELLAHQNELLEDQLKSVTLITKERDSSQLPLTTNSMNNGIVDALDALMIPGNQSMYDNAELRQSMEILSANYDLSKAELKDLNIRLEQLMKEKNDLDGLVVNLQSQLQSAHERESNHPSEIKALKIDIDRLTAKLEMLTNAASASPQTNDNSDNHSSNKNNSDINLEMSTQHAELLALVEDMKRKTEESRMLHSTELAAATVRMNDLLTERESLQAVIRQAQDFQIVQESELKGQLAEVANQLIDMQGKNSELMQAVERAQQALRDQVANGTDASKVVESLQQEQIIANTQFETQLQALRSRNVVLEEEVNLLNTRIKTTEGERASVTAAAEQETTLTLREELAGIVAQLNETKTHLQTATDSLQLQSTNVDVLTKENQQLQEENQQLREQQVDHQQIHDTALKKQQNETASLIAEIEKLQQQLVDLTQQQQKNIETQTNEEIVRNKELQDQLTNLQNQLEQERTQQQLQLATSVEPVSLSANETESQTMQQLELAAIQLRDSITIIGKLKAESEESKEKIEQLQKEIDHLQSNPESCKAKVSFEEEMRRESISPFVKSLMITTGMSTNKLSHNGAEDGVDDSGKRRQGVVGANYLPKQEYENDETRRLSLQIPEEGNLNIPEGFALSPDNRAGGGASARSPGHFEAAPVLDPETAAELKKEKSAIPPVKEERFASVKNIFPSQSSSNSIGSANSGGGSGGKPGRLPPAAGATIPSDFPKRFPQVVSSVVMMSRKSEEIDEPSAEIEEQLHASTHGDGGENHNNEEHKQNKIWEAHLSGWKTACANLRTKADHDRQELKTCQLKLKSTKAMLRSALEGDFTENSLGAKVLQHATKNRIQTFEDLTAFINKADETTLHEQILTATVSDLTIELKAQKHGESFGLWKQIEVLKDEKEFLLKKSKELDDVTKEFMALKVEHRDLQQMMYETSQRLLRAKQEIAVLKRSKAVPLRAVITMEQLRSASPDHNMNAIVENAVSTGTLQYAQSTKSDNAGLSDKVPEQKPGRLSPSLDVGGGGATPGELPPMFTPLAHKTVKIASQSPIIPEKSFRFQPVSREVSTLGEHEEDAIIMPNFNTRNNPRFMQDLASAAKRKRLAEEMRGIDSIKSMYRAGSSHSVEMIAFEKEKKAGMKGYRREGRRRSSLFK